MSNLFYDHKLNETGMIKAEGIQEAFNKCLEQLLHICPDSREFSLAKTKLEEACFYAKKSMAQQPGNQEHKEKNSGQ